MITASQLVDLRPKAIDFTETERLKALFARLRDERDPLYLTADEFDQILRWKLRGQYGRQKAWRKANTDKVIQTVTRAALSIDLDDLEYETALRISILCTLRGVGVPVASAVLALVYPEQYAVVDFRTWRQIFDYQRTSFSIPQYLVYMRKLHELAQELDWPVQEVDLAIWEYDRVHGWSQDG